MVFAFFANSVGDEQHSYPSSKTKCLPALLPCLIGAVLLEKSIGILKDMHGVFKADAMFLPIGPRFHGVPLEPNHPY